MMRSRDARSIPGVRACPVPSHARRLVGHAPGHGRWVRLACLPRSRVIAKDRVGSEWPISSDGKRFDRSSLRPMHEQSRRLPADILQAMWSDSHRRSHRRRRCGPRQSADASGGIDQVTTPATAEQAANDTARTTRAMAMAAGIRSNRNDACGGGPDATVCSSGSLRRKREFQRPSREWRMRLAVGRPGLGS